MKQYKVTRDVVLVFTMLVCACSAPPAAQPAPTTSTPAPTVSIATAPTTVAPATPAPTPGKLRIGESASIAGPGGEIRITVQSAAATTRPSFLGTAPPGMSYVTVVVRYDNGLSETVQVSENPWQMASADGVRRTSVLSGRDDYLRVSAVLPGTFVVGSLTYEVPAGALDLYYVQPNASRVIVWTVR